MKKIVFILILFIQLHVQGQNFVTKLYFEDSFGQKDTLIFGRVEGASIGFDTNFGEVDIKENTIADLDVRFFDYISDNTVNHDALPWYCDYVPGDFSVANDDGPFLEYLSEQKVSVRALNECTEKSNGFRHHFFIPYNAAFPITISWDKEIFQDACNQNSNISEIPFERQDWIEEFGGEFCTDSINYPNINLVEHDSVIIEQPNYLSFLRANSTLVSVYYLTVTNRTDGSILINTNNLIESKIQLTPNPTQDKLFLEIADQNLQYQIVNLKGQRMMQGIYQNGIKVEQLPKGIYFLQLQKDAELYQTIKFVKE